MGDPKAGERSIFFKNHFVGGGEEQEKGTLEPQCSKISPDLLLMVKEQEDSFHLNNRKTVP